MMDGERKVWAAAFVNRLSNIHDPTYDFFTSQGSLAAQKRALCKLAVESAEFADQAVNAMKVAQKEFKRQKKTATLEYERLVDMREGRY